MTVKPYTAHTFCSFCGSAQVETEKWPRECGYCHNTAWGNPLPVCVAIQPTVEGGIVLIRRNIDPGKGGLALPGGYMDFGETWQKCCSRELREETGIVSVVQPIEPITVISVTSRNTLQLFCLMERLREADLPPYVPNSEVTERLIVRDPIKLVFNSHTQVLADVFTRLNEQRARVKLME